MRERKKKNFQQLKWTCGRVWAWLQHKTCIKWRAKWNKKRKRNKNRKAQQRHRQGADRAGWLASCLLLHSIPFPSPSPPPRGRGNPTLSLLLPPFPLLSPFHFSSLLTLADFICYDCFDNVAASFDAHLQRCLPAFLPHNNKMNCNNNKNNKNISPVIAVAACSRSSSAARRSFDWYRRQKASALDISEVGQVYYNIIWYCQLRRLQKFFKHRL